MSMRIIPFLAAAFITFVTAQPVLAQTPGAPPQLSNQAYVQKDGKWMVCLNGECKPLSKKACEDIAAEREQYLLNLQQKLLASVPGDGGVLVNGVLYGQCGGDPDFVKDQIKALMADLLLESYSREQVCLQFVEDTTMRIIKRMNNGRQIERMSTSSSSKTSGKSSLSAPTIAPAGLLETGADGARQGPSPAGTPSGATQASPTFRSR
jgi:hypothetical protein